MFKRSMRIYQKFFEAIMNIRSLLLVILISCSSYIAAQAGSSRLPGPARLNYEKLLPKKNMAQQALTRFFELVHKCAPSISIDSLGKAVSQLSHEQQLDIELKALAVLDAIMPVLTSELILTDGELEKYKLFFDYCLELGKESDAHGSQIFKHHLTYLLSKVGQHYLHFYRNQFDLGAAASFLENFQKFADCFHSYNYNNSTSAALNELISTVSKGIWYHSYITEIFYVTQAYLRLLNITPKGEWKPHTDDEDKRYWRDFDFLEQQYPTMFKISHQSQPQAYIANIRDRLAHARTLFNDKKPALSIREILADKEVFASKKILTSPQLNAAEKKALYFRAQVALKKSVIAAEMQFRRQSHFPPKELKELVLLTLDEEAAKKRQIAFNIANAKWGTEVVPPHNDLSALILSLQHKECTRICTELENGTLEPDDYAEALITLHALDRSQQFRTYRETYLKKATEAKQQKEFADMLNDFSHVRALCAKNKFGEAAPVAQKLRNKAISEIDVQLQQLYTDIAANTIGSKTSNRTELQKRVALISGNVILAKELIAELHPQPEYAAESTDTVAVVAPASQQQAGSSADAQPTKLSKKEKKAREKAVKHAAEESRNALLQNAAIVLKAHEDEMQKRKEAAAEQRAIKIAAEELQAQERAVAVNRQIIPIPAPQPLDKTYAQAVVSTAAPVTPEEFPQLPHAEIFTPALAAISRDTQLAPILEQLQEYVMPEDDLAQTEEHAGLTASVDESAASATTTIASEAARRTLIETITGLHQRVQQLRNPSASIDIHPKFEGMSPAMIIGQGALAIEWLLGNNHHEITALLLERWDSSVTIPMLCVLAAIQLHRLPFAEAHRAIEALLHYTHTITTHSQAVFDAILANKKARTRLINIRRDEFNRNIENAAGIRINLCHFLLNIGDKQLFKLFMRSSQHNSGLIAPNGYEFMKKFIAEQYAAASRLMVADTAEDIRQRVLGIMVNSSDLNSKLEMHAPALRSLVLSAITQ